MPDLTVLAMGGNSLIDPALPPTVENQFALTRAAMEPVADLIAAGEHLVMTHGNGPQVGFMLLRVELARTVLHEVKLDSLVADTQGGLGYMIQGALRNALVQRGHGDREVISVITEVKVDPDDRAFEEPTKPVGQFYSADEAAELTREHGWQLVEDAHRGYRRVVPSPSPVDIVQLETIKRLVDAGVVCIACGGGGIPVIEDADGNSVGIEGVIDKDRASALLAVKLGAKRLIITTAVDAVCVDFMKPTQRALPTATVSEIRQHGRDGQFAPGSMRPKMDAAIYFLNRGGAEVLICRPDQLTEALRGETGTVIRPD